MSASSCPISVSSVLEFSLMMDLLNLIIIIIIIIIIVIVIMH